MAITVEGLIGLPELQLELLAGGQGCEREVQWAHTCDLPDPWQWVGENQALLTNGSTIPTAAEDQLVWAQTIATNKIAAVGVGAQMGGPALTSEMLAYCDEVSLPIFTIPYPLPFVAVAQAVADSATMAQSIRQRTISRLYDFTRRDQNESSSAAEAIETIGAIIGRDIAVVDEHCMHSWVAPSTLPEWVPSLTASEFADASIRVPTVLESTSGAVVHAIPLGALPGALAIFRPSGTVAFDQSILLHATSVLGAVLSQRELLNVHENRAHSEYLNRILIDQNRFGFESAGWMSQLGYSGTVRGVALVGPSELREATVSRLQRHGVRVSATLQSDRHLLVAQHNRVRTLLEHCLEYRVRAGIGSEVDTSLAHESLKQSLWALSSIDGDEDRRIAEFDSETPWFGFSDPQAGEDFVMRVLGPLLDDSPSHAILLETLDAYLRSNRSPQKTAERLVVHRQTVVQRLKKIEKTLARQLSDTSTIAQLWIAMTLREATGHANLFNRNY